MVIIVSKYLVLVIGSKLNANVKRFWTCHRVFFSTFHMAAAKDLTIRKGGYTAVERGDLERHP